MPSMRAKAYWLFKTEPETYSFDTLLRERSTNWNGVRNFQARNFLRQATAGDLAIIYHSGKDKAAVGVARVTRGAYPDPDPKKPGDWVQLDLEAVEKFATSVTLARIKAEPKLKGVPLIRQSQLSCMPLSASEFETLHRLGKKP